MSKKFTNIFFKNIKKNVSKKFPENFQKCPEKCYKNILKKRRRRFYMTKNHFNNKKSILQVFLGLDFQDQYHTG